MPFIDATACVGQLTEEHVSKYIDSCTSCSVGPLLCARAVAPIMIKQRAGIVAVTGSVFAEYTAPFNGAYASSKAAVTSLFDALRLELAPFGVSVCIIEPGFFSSKLRNESFDANKYLDGQSVYSSFSQTMSDLVDYQDTLRYVVSADEVAKVVVKKICSKRGPPPRILVGTYSWVFKFAALLYKYVAPRLMHTAFVFWFGLRMRNQRHV